nr:unnamed protein product [Digitaria exilis]
MGSAASAAVPPPPPPEQAQAGSLPYGPGLAGILPPKPEGEEKEEKKVDYLNLPCPVPFEEIQREALSSFHSVFMGSLEVPSQSTETIKVPTAHYEFGANFLDPKLMLIGRVMTDGRLNARVKCDLTENLTLKVNAQLTQEPHYSQGMFNFDYTVSIPDNFFTYTCVCTKGPELLLRMQHNHCFQTFQVGTLQVASTGIVALSYVQKVSEKVALASDFMYNHMSKDVTASFGYDYLLRQCRLRGKIDSNGVVAAYLEERLNMGVNFLLSAEIDHCKKNYKFGFGMTVGE